MVPSLSLSVAAVDAVTEARFWQNVGFNFMPDACWPWLGEDTTGAGYGRFKINGRRMSANRVAFALANGFVPSRMFVCHSCDNPTCVRPDHLFLGTPQENMEDRGRKKRHAHGSRTGTAILTEEQVIEICGLLRAGGIPAREIGKRYGVAKTTIQKISQRINWAHIWERLPAA